MVLYCYTPFVLTSVVNYMKLLVVINLFIIRNRFTLLVISHLQPKTTLKIQEFQQAKIRLNPQSMNIPHQILKNRIVTKILRKKSIKIVNYEISLETGLLNSTSQEMLLLLSWEDWKPLKSKMETTNLCQATSELFSRPQDLWLFKILEAEDIFTLDWKKAFRTICRNSVIHPCQIKSTLWLALMEYLSRAVAKVNFGQYVVLWRVRWILFQ